MLQILYLYVELYWVIIEDYEKQFLSTILCLSESNVHLYIYIYPHMPAVSLPSKRERERKKEKNEKKEREKSVRRSNNVLRQRALIIRCSLFHE
jgi:hypothetical protein